MSEVFGDCVKNLRVKRNISVYKLCQTLEYNQSNWGKIEKGLLRPPKNDKVLHRFVSCLELNKATTSTFYDLASLAKNELPKDIAYQVNKDKTSARELLDFFATMRSKTLCDYEYFL